jgi:hypothetical protein
MSPVGSTLYADRWPPSGLDGNYIVKYKIIKELYVVQVFGIGGVVSPWSK